MREREKKCILLMDVECPKKSAVTVANERFTLQTCTGRYAIELEARRIFFPPQEKLSQSLEISIVPRGDRNVSLTESPTALESQNHLAILRTTILS